MAAIAGGLNQPGPPLSPVLTPKVFVIAMFDAEASSWLCDESSVKLTRKMTIPGLFRQYPDIWYNDGGDVCLMISGMGLINAATSITSLVHSPLLDLRNTYFLVTGIAGVNPAATTIGSVTFAKFAIQVDLQVEYDAREIPPDWPTGYVPLEAKTLGGYPSQIFGTEVYELNGILRQEATALAKKATLSDSREAAAHRARYTLFEAASRPPSIVEGDVTSSNVFFSGYLLAESVERYVKLLTSNKANYYMTAMEDNAVLEALLRAAKQGKVDFGRIVLMRSGSNFDRPPTKDIKPAIPFVLDHGGFIPACHNLYLAGREIVHGILEGWEATFCEGIEHNNYIGDVFGTLGGEPDFGPEK